MHASVGISSAAVAPHSGQVMTECNAISTVIPMTFNVRDQRRRAVGAPLAQVAVRIALAVAASGVTTSAERCIA